MGWLSLLNAIFSLGELVAKIVHDKQLMDAGEAKASLKSLQVMNERVKKAKSNRIIARGNTDLRERVHAKYEKSDDD